MVTVTSDPVVQAQLEQCLRAAQEKILRENKACQKRFEESLARGIKERMRQVRAQQ